MSRDSSVHLIALQPDPEQVSNSRSPELHLSFKTPKFHISPELKYSSADPHTHLDIAGRVHVGADDDRYIRPIDGRLAKLIVQTTFQTRTGQGKRTWSRTVIWNRSSKIIQYANWPTFSLPNDHKVWTRKDWVRFYARWIPSCAALMVLVRSQFPHSNP